VRGPAAALEMIEPLGARLQNYFHFFGVKGAFLMQLGRKRRSAGCVRPRHRARQHLSRSRPHPHASGPADARQQTARGAK